MKIQDAYKREIQRNIISQRKLFYALAIIIFLFTFLTLGINKRVINQHQELTDNQLIFIKKSDSLRIAQDSIIVLNDVLNKQKSPTIALSHFYFKKRHGK